MGHAVVKSARLILQRDVPHQHGFTAGGLLHGHGGVVDVIQRGDICVDLTQLNAAPANLYLVIHAAYKVQAVFFQAHVVAGAVGALPAHGFERRVLLRILLWVQVAGQTHATDDQFAGLAQANGLALLIDDHQIPPIQRQTDRNRAPRNHPLRAGDDRGLRRAVGIPHLAVLGGQAVHQLLGAGLAADDEQADIIQRLRRPQARQGRDRGDDGDIAANQPWTKVHTGAHQGTRSRDQAAAVAPGQPHFFAGCVEGNGKPSQHAVFRAKRAVGMIDEEEAGLRVHEGGRGAVAYGHALRLARGTGGKDDPRGIFWPRGLDALCRVARGFAQEAEAVIAKQAINIGLTKDHLRALIRIVRVHRHVGRTGGQGGQDGEVKIPLAGGHPDADAIAPAHAIDVQLCGPQLDLVDEFGVGDDLAIVKRGGFRMDLSRGGNNVPQRARARGQIAQEKLLRDAGKI